MPPDQQPRHHQAPNGLQPPPLPASGPQLHSHASAPLPNGRLGTLQQSGAHPPTPPLGLSSVPGLGMSHMPAFPPPPQSSGAPVKQVSRVHRVRCPVKEFSVET